MKLLTRLYIRNWHKIQREIIPFAMLNFLTGKNTAGKSTIIDALQFILLGDKSGHYFNRAANDKSVRTLKGYLFAQNGYSDETSSFTYERENKNFNTYLLAEFHNQKTGTYFTIGAIFDCYKDLESDMKYVTFEGRIPDHEFIVDGKSMNSAAIKGYFQTHYSVNTWDMTDSVDKYKSNIQKLFGPIKSNFFKLFRKSVPFSPIMNIKQFITEFVSDIQEKVEVEHLRDNIRRYKMLERDLRRVQSQIVALEEIEASYNTVVNWLIQIRLEQFLIDQSECDGKKNQISRKLLALSDAKEAITLLGMEQAQFTEVGNTLQQQLTELIELHSAKKAYWDKLQAELTNAKTEVNASEQALDKVEQLVGQAIVIWRALVEQIEAAGFTTDSLEQLAIKIDEIQNKFADRPWLFTYENLNTFSKAMKNILDDLREMLLQLREEQSRIEQDRKTLQQKLELLNNGIHAYDNPNIVLLKNAIGTELSSKYGKRIEAEVFCELIEIRNDKWNDAIEGYLNHQRFYLIVAPEYFIDALRIYNRIKTKHRIYNIGLVDIDKVIDRNIKFRAGSLAEEIETDHPYAQAYANYLLGDVMKVEHVERLREHSKAITPTCMLYQGFVARQINPAHYQTPYIGKKSIHIRIAQLMHRIKELKQSWAELQKKRLQLEVWSRRDALSDSEISDLLGTDKNAGYVAIANELEERRLVVRSIDKKIVTVDRVSLIAYQKQRSELEEKIVNNGENIKNTGERIGELKQNVDTFNKDIITLEEEELTLRKRRAEQYEESWRSESGDPAYILAKERLGDCDRVLAHYSKAIEQTKKSQEEAFQIVMNLREQFTLTNKGCTLSLVERTNDSWSSELADLQMSSITDYEEKITQAKKRAQEQFQEDFISKLKSNIETIIEQMDELNAAIQHAPFGRNRYRFEVKPSGQYKAYYDMIMDELLIDGYNLFSFEFRNRHGEVVDALFQKIMETGEDSLAAEHLQQLEENLAIYMDCRTYLEFDLIEIGEDDRESRLSKDIATKSGGETQTPFYIAVLASFVQTYRVKSQTYNNTPRLIVFDEAFSKMDHQRIRESIKLVRDMGLQLIISAPTEKISDIAPIVDRNLIVVRVKKQTVVRAFDPKEFIEGE